MTVGGVVLGLVITFRTSSAYERYTDGSKFWTNISTASKTMAQQVRNSFVAKTPKREA